MKSPLVPVALYTSGGPELFGPANRAKPAGSLTSIDELCSGLEAPTGDIVLADPVVNRSDEAALLLAEAYARRAPAACPRIERVEWLPRPLPASHVADVLSAAHRVEVTIQNTDPEVRRRYARRFRPSDYRQTLEELGSLGIAPVLMVETGIPGETLESVLETLQLAYSLEPQQVRLRRLEVAPGTFFDRNRERYRVVSDPEPPHYVRAHLTASPLELVWIEELALKSCTSYNHWIRRRDAAATEELDDRRKLVP